MDPKIETRKDIYDDGALEAERVVRIEADGSEVNHGPYVRWHKNGLKAEEGVYENGLKVGRWRSWLDTGQNFFDGDYLVEGQPFSIEEPAPQPEATKSDAGNKGGQHELKGMDGAAQHHGQHAYPGHLVHKGTGSGNGGDCQNKCRRAAACSIGDRGLG